MDRDLSTLTDPDKWESLCRKAGRNPVNYIPTQSWTKTAPQTEHLVLRIDAPEETLIYKEIRRPAEQNHFLGLIAAQTRAAAALSRHPLARVPAVLSYDLQSRSMLMEHAPGETVFDICERAPTDPEPLRLVGQWLDAFHRIGDTETRRYQPRFMTDHLAWLVERIVSGREPIVAADEFTAAAAKLTASASDAEGHPTISAQRHGDPISRNILIGDGLVRGIDLGPAATGPVGFDIARFLVSWAETCADPDTLAPGEVVPATMMKAFFSGYRLVPVDDPTIRFLLRMRVLSNWRMLPPDTERMTLPDIVRLERLRLLARNALSG